MHQSKSKPNFSEYLDNCNFCLPTADTVFLCGTTALNDALREEVQRLKLATGQLSNGQGMSLGQQMGVNPQLYQLHQQLQQQQQPQGNHQHQPVQQNSHADFLQRSAFGALQGLAGSLGGAFLKSEGNGIAVNQGSSASF